MKASKFNEFYAPKRGWITDLGVVDRRDKFKVRLDNLPGEFEGQTGSVYQFSLDKKRDLYINLKNLSHDLDLYLTYSNWDQVQEVNQDTQELEFVYSDRIVPLCVLDLPMPTRTPKAGVRPKCLNPNAYVNTINSLTSIQSSAYRFSYLFFIYQP